MKASGKVDFRAKTTRNREGHKDTRVISQQDITILNVCAPNTRAAKYVKQKLIELLEEIDESMITVGDFNTPLSAIDRTTKEKTSKDIDEFNNTIIDEKLINKINNLTEY